MKIYEGISSDDGKEIVIDPKLEAVVNRMFQRCFDDGKYKQVNSSVRVYRGRAKNFFLGAHNTRRLTSYFCDKRRSTGKS